MEGEKDKHTVQNAMWQAVPVLFPSCPVQEKENAFERCRDRQKTKRNHSALRTFKPALHLSSNGGAPARCSREAAAPKGASLVLTRLRFGSKKTNCVSLLSVALFSNKWSGYSRAAVISRMPRYCKTIRCSIRKDRHSTFESKSSEQQHGARTVGLAGKLCGSTTQKIHVASCLSFASVVPSPSARKCFRAASGSAKNEAQS